MTAPERVAPRPTRARTRPGRLARLDEDLLVEEGALLARRDGVVVDLGFGAVPVTTRELAAALPAHLRVVGVESEPRAVASAGPGDDRVRFVRGGFELPAAARPALVVRMLNVLRGYPPGEAAPARRSVGDALVEGGLLIEGTSGPEGEVMVVHWLRKRGAVLVPEAMLFSTAFVRGFAPLVFRDRLPRDLRGTAHDGTALGAWFSDWCRAYEAVRQGTSDPRARFVAAARTLASWRDDVPVREDRWAVGRMWWRGCAPSGMVGA